MCLKCHRLKGDRFWVRMTRLRLALVDANEASVAQKLEEEIQRGGGGVDYSPNKDQEVGGDDIGVEHNEESGILLSNEKKEKGVDELIKKKRKETAVLLQHEKRLAQSKRAKRLSIHNRMYVHNDSCTYYYVATNVIFSSVSIS